MNLYEKIKAMYPELTDADFLSPLGAITLQNDGNEDYIKEWNHTSLSKPTDEQLKGVN